jgi:hypothetical protein
MIIISLFFLFPLLALANCQNGQQRAKLYNNRVRASRYAKVSKAQNKVLVKILYHSSVSFSYLFILPVLTTHFARSATKLATKNARGWILKLPQMLLLLI